MLKKCISFTRIFLVILCLGSNTELVCRDKKNEVVECIKRNKKAIAITGGAVTGGALLLGLAYWQRKMIIEKFIEAGEGYACGFMAWPVALMSFVIERKPAWGNVEGIGKPLFILGAATNIILLGTGLHTLVSKARELKNNKESNSKSSFKNQMAKLKALG